MTVCLEQYILSCDTNTKNKPANYKGVNNKGFLDAVPQRIVTQILHCPMGLVNKALEAFRAWVTLDIEDLNDDDATTLRSVYKLAKQKHATAVQQLDLASAIVEANLANQQAKEQKNAAKKARLAAKKEEKEAKEKFDDVMLWHNAKKSSLTQQFESVFRSNGIKREHHHMNT